MGSRFPVGDYYSYMIADRTGREWADSPVQDSEMPLYLGKSPSVPEPGMRFQMTVRSRVVHHVASVLPPEHDLNPFQVPLVMIQRLKETEI